MQLDPPVSDKCWEQEGGSEDNCYGLDGDMRMFVGGDAILAEDGPLAGANLNVAAAQTQLDTIERSFQLDLNLEGLSNLEDNIEASINLAEAIAYVPSERVLIMGENASNLTRRIIAQGIDASVMEGMDQDEYFMRLVGLYNILDEYEENGLETPEKFIEIVDLLEQDFVVFAKSLEGQTILRETPRMCLAQVSAGCGPINADPCVDDSQCGGGASFELPRAGAQSAGAGQSRIDTAMYHSLLGISLGLSTGGIGGQNQTPMAEAAESLIDDAVPAGYGDAGISGYDGYGDGDLITDGAGEGLTEGSGNFSPEESDSDSLFRGDGREPDQVFEEGLEPWDENGELALEDHVNENPSPQEDNSWVSTSKDPNVAADTFSDEGGNVYEIDADAPNGVDVNETLGEENVDYPEESEVAFDQGVKTCYIKGCWTVGPGGSLTNFQPNPNYNPMPNPSSSK